MPKGNGLIPTFSRSGISGTEIQNVAEKQDSQDAGSNVFLMIRFRAAKEFETLTEVLEETLDQYSLTLIRADYEHHHGELRTNVRHCMDTSTYGVAVFEHIAEPTLSQMSASNLVTCLRRERDVCC